MPPLRGWRPSASRKRQEGKTSEKNEDKESDQATEDETSYSNPGNGCAHRGRRTQQKTEIVKKMERVLNPVTLDHSVASYDPEGSYRERILLIPVTLPTGGGVTV